ncbi:MAG: 2-polyprenylphenol 6-hydroxylase [Candidatus Desantisbacteria bacterium]
MHIPYLTDKYKDIKRFQFVINVLLKHGLGHIISRLNLEHHLSLWRRIIHRPSSETHEIWLSAPERLRMAMEELGPTFIKFGQILSTRPDIVPAEYIKEFEKLQDDIHPFPFEDVRAIIKKELHLEIEDLFKEFSEQPIAAASIAQVHRAVLPSGKLVVVKLRRPGIEEIIEADLRILFALANLLEKRIPSTKQYNPMGIIKEFERNIKKELNFTKEAYHIEQFQKNFQNEPTICIPNVYWETTSKKILTMEAIDGIKVSDIKRIEEAGLDPKIIAKNGVRAILKQVFVDGFFHGDPHPGNIYVLEGNRIAFLDFGIVGRIDERMQQNLSDAILGMLLKNTQQIIDCFWKLEAIDEDVDKRALKADLDAFVERYYEIPLEKLKIGWMMQDVLEIAIRNKLKILPEFLLLAKTLIVIEGVGLMLDPTFEIIPLVQPLVSSVVKKRLAPSKIFNEALKLTTEFGSLIKTLPQEIDLLLKKLQSGKLKIEFEHQGLGDLIKEFDRVSNRLSFALIVAATIIASSLMVQANIGPLVWGIPLLGLIGFIISGVLGMFLLVLIIISGRF